MYIAARGSTIIIHDKFVWLHFPKCAGTKAQNLFQKNLKTSAGVYQDLVDPKNDTTHKWYDALLYRSQCDPSFSAEGRTIVYSFRRLPRWLESRFNFDFSSAQRSHSNWLNQPELLLEGQFHWVNGKQERADKVCRSYISEPLLELGRLQFLRAEFFEEDFKRCFGEFVDVSEIPDWEFERYANDSENHIPEHIIEKLRNDAGSLYKKCPYWHRVESNGYPDEGSFRD